MELVAPTSRRWRRGRLRPCSTQKSQYCRKHSSDMLPSRWSKMLPHSWRGRYLSAGVNNALCDDGSPGRCSWLCTRTWPRDPGKGNTRRSKEPIMSAQPVAGEGTGNHPSLLVIRTKGRRRSYYVLGRCSSLMPLFELA